MPKFTLKSAGRSKPSAMKAVQPKMKAAAPKKEPVAEPKRTFKSESHSYDQARESRPVVSRYKTSRA